MVKDRRKNRARAKQGNRRGGTLSMLIRPYLQIRLGFMLLVTNLVFGVLISGVVYYFVSDIHDSVRLYFQFTQEEAAENWQKFFVPLAVCLSLVGVFFFITLVMIIRYTHQIYGPLVSIHGYLDELLLKSYKGPLEIRATDQLTSLAQKLNQLTEKYELISTHQSKDHEYESSHHKYES